MQSHISAKIKFRCIIGILRFERKKKQKICIHFKAGANEFLDYAQCIKKIKKYYKTKQFHTLEESLEYTCKKLKKHFPQIFYITVSIYKTQIIKNARVGVSLEKKY
ncbi:dihydroneopterin aldolase [Campylobacter sp. MIT 21-1685]|uniref:dihydroneopterin aldolase n=1 Tax=unclassified Campylobacter TaxID=2593542 RepID=UPI00224AB35E|nr:MULTISPECIES: dihydroneopterin aldolase [unclassified Campylobacter]MCX2683485.1 dihydroneopterin aldolase [Campylobacter sp. MIT 21-1684]MCX2751766.1 dihydroneopterin aldolase [Campylobacter sp. MIT 21-1682]MCX2807967.1 dihydroneopterin aldolase [Campylobacter sp. MIT 21-1685]